MLQKKGAKVPGFKVISRLNIIGSKFFSYKDTDKLIKYLNLHTIYTKKELTVYKPLSFIFVVLAFISFAISLIFSRFKILVVLLFIFPNQAKANDFLGCLYEYLSFKKAAINEFKHSNTDFAKIKMTIYYLQKGKFKNALNEINQVRNHPKKNFLKALILAKMHKYKEAFEILENSNLDKEEIKLYNLLKKYTLTNQKSVIYEVNSSKKHKNTPIKIKKEPLW